jgi:hypothetical protein
MKTRTQILVIIYWLLSMIMYEVKAVNRCRAPQFIALMERAEKCLLAHASASVAPRLLTVLLAAKSFILRKALSPLEAMTRILMKHVICVRSPSMRLLFVQYALMFRACININANLTYVFANAGTRCSYTPLGA